MPGILSDDSHKVQLTENEFAYLYNELKTFRLRCDPPDEHPSVGDIYVDASTGMEYILARTNVGEYTFISLANGNRYTEPEHCEYGQLTPEFVQAIGGSGFKFVRRASDAVTDPVATQTTKENDE